MTPSISVILGTLGRPHLARSIRSLTDQQTPVEVVLVADPAGNVPHIRRVAEYFGVAVHEQASETSRRGDDQKNHGMSLATGTHLAFLDDDDEAAPGSIAAMLDRASDRPVLFRMDHPDLGAVWRTPTLRFGNIGTPCLLIPNQPSRLGTWAPFLGLPSNKAVGGGDFHFLMGTVERMGAPMWDERMVCRVRPT